MSVIVMGMEMPTNCALCGCSFCAMRYAGPGHSRPEWCPLVELPEKHGRLVDVDAIIAELKDGDAESGVKASGADLVVAILLAYLDSKPTIVESEGD